ncbi:NAD(P)/FAD-dependent oxidoreductase [Vibrio sp. SS-MA-C1-2]|nr:NAD(P)/FAD-dependent oxidoreductase [Vibrio sp. SS-MA-C1-2]UJF18463.1 NAD(P)/FAD-dependent oxidoreductase [Vibrio sp. SS-MA-C1-2]
MTKLFDIVIIGAGPSGMMAALTARKKVYLLRLLMNKQHQGGKYFDR